MILSKNVLSILICLILQIHAFTSLNLCRKLGFNNQLVLIFHKYKNSMYNLNLFNLTFVQVKNNIKKEKQQSASTPAGNDIL